ncbi:MAG: hypothetical protein HYX89_01785 [Chloroflexi bacterium]|nr:hypothetical protein [Chloroflexota bacterium]
MADPITISMCELLSALSVALDLGMGAPVEHSVRASYVATRLGHKLRLSSEEVTDIFYGTLLKDCG